MRKCLIFMEYTVGSADLCALFGACERNVKTIKTLEENIKKWKKDKDFNQAVVNTKILVPVPNLMNYPSHNSATSKLAEILTANDLLIF